VSLLPQNAKEVSFDGRKYPDMASRALQRFAGNRLSSLVESIGHADNAEKVRAVLALTLVGVLVALQFEPSHNQTLTTAAETLAFAVVAFYFGLHSGAPSGPEPDVEPSGPTPPDGNGELDNSPEPGAEEHLAAQADKALTETQQHLDEQSARIKEKQERLREKARQLKFKLR
jgi:hypothetical protein